MPVWLWVIIGVAILGALSGGKSSGKKAASGQPFRIDHPHYIDDDDSECSRCGARFKEKVMECPRCGTRFGTAREDDLEFMEEMEIFDGDED